jgi:hypothetical protein
MANYSKREKRRQRVLEALDATPYASLNCHGAAITDGDRDCVRAPLETAGAVTVLPG